MQPPNTDDQRQLGDGPNGEGGPTLPPPPQAAPSPAAPSASPTAPPSPTPGATRQDPFGLPGGEVPDVEVPDLDGRERELAPAVVTAWRLSGILPLLFPSAAAIALGFVFLGRWGFLVAAVVAGLAVLLLGVYPPARYRRWRWRLTPLGLELSRGVLVRYHDAVPYFRIQQIDIVQGPLDRLLKLATLQVTTASASGSATLPGIANADAPGVRAALLARAAKAVGDHPGDLRDAV
jgi:membrane protein YdbS with pleckstrin-like domain